METESRLCSPRNGGGTEMIANGHKRYFWVDRNILRLDHDDCDTTF